MQRNFNDEVYQFIEACNKFSVKMLLVGGSAVNYYGYKRHSADIDFWVNNTSENLENLLKALIHIGYSLDRFPDEVLQGEQNISLKFSPDLEIEIIVQFNPGKSFEEAFNESVEFVTQDQKFLKWNIISYESLINSKRKSGRPKDLLDIKELQRINRDK